MSFFFHISDKVLILDTSDGRKGGVSISFFFGGEMACDDCILKTGKCHCWEGGRRVALLTVSHVPPPTIFTSFAVSTSFVSSSKRYFKQMMGLQGLALLTIVNPCWGIVWTDLPDTICGCGEGNSANWPSSNPEGTDLIFCTGIFLLTEFCTVKFLLTEHFVLEYHY